MATEKRQPLTALLLRKRVELDLTQKQAAEKMGVSWRSYQRWEEGVSIPRPQHQGKIAAFLGMEFADLNALVEHLDTTDFSGAEERILDEVRRLLDQRGG